MSGDRLFPIMALIASRVPARTIPWCVIAPHAAQAQRNHDQTLERLANRGGLAPCEAVAVLEDRDWHAMPDDEAVAQLDALVAMALAGDVA